MVIIMVVIVMVGHLCKSCILQSSFFWSFMVICEEQLLLSDLEKICADKWVTWDHSCRRKRKASGWYFWVASPALGFLSPHFPSLVTLNDPPFTCLIKLWFPNLNVGKVSRSPVRPGSLSPSPLILLPSSPCLPHSLSLSPSLTVSFSCFPWYQTKTIKLCECTHNKWEPSFCSTVTASVLWLQGFLLFWQSILESHVWADIPPLSDCPNQLTYAYIR